MNTLPAGIGLATALLAASAASAQTPQAPTPAPAPAAPAPKTEGTTVSGVTVKAGDPPMKSSIDSRSYSVAGDLQATSGSVADALKRIPSVEVDIDGNVTLRGDPSVTILIDGKPSGAMKSQSRADVLQQMPADRIDRVEVMTNPGAQYSPEGTGGVINLITKKGDKAGAGASGAMRVSVGDQQRYNAGVNFAYNNAKLSVSGDAGLNRYANRFQAHDDRLFTGPGGTIRRLQLGRGQNAGLGWNSRLGADYDLNPKNHLNAEFSYGSFPNDFSNFTDYQTFNALGTPVGRTQRRAEIDIGGAYANASLGWRRTFAGDDHSLSLELDGSTWRNHQFADFETTTSLPATPTVFEDLDVRIWSKELDLKGDYSRPMPGSARLKAGFDLDRTKDRFGSLAAKGLTLNTKVFDPTQSHQLTFDETVLSAYLTYEKPFGDLTVLGGLRYETATNDIDLPTTGFTNSHGYDKLYPSLHLDYKLSDTSRLKASYSLRITRPNSWDLDPFPVKLDALNYRQGNPNLEPSETQSWEASFEYRKQRNYYLLTAFWRENENGVTDVVTDLGGGQTLTTKANLATSRSGGIEFVVNRALSKTLSLNATGTALYNQIDATSLGYSGDRSTYAFGGRASLDWQVTPVDLLQFNTVLNAKALTPQGYVKPTYGVNLGYRRKLNDRLSLTVTATDILETLKNEVVYDAPDVKGTFTRRRSSRGVFIGLRYRFGAGKPQREGFDYNAGNGGGAGGPPS
ncbi:TonB-dependent receptor domain-containing protein [Caulobacter ginsengisoli]|uniref:TonB-dependent receptor domain-containing protein n=1 Tax=Caulobacter ginsengisoli TaxID=400775 RepID=UPI0027D8E691|nr:TonB-dependent receptor [Caulobacter ginsengisoli]